MYMVLSLQPSTWDDVLIMHTISLKCQTKHVLTTSKLLTTMAILQGSPKELLGPLAMVALTDGHRYKVSKLLG